MTAPAWEPAAVAGYVLILVALLTWELLGLRSSSDRWPPLTEIVRWLLRRPGWRGWLARVALAIFLLWLPVHFFLQG